MLPVKRGKVIHLGVPGGEPWMPERETLLSIDHDLDSLLYRLRMPACSRAGLLPTGARTETDCARCDNHPCCSSTC
jgi:hypothetical protein